MIIRYRTLSMPHVSVLLPSAGPPPTRETVLPVDATLPAIATALAILESELRRIGLGVQAARAAEIAKAVELYSIADDD